jgi:hypothetical protein
MASPSLFEDGPLWALKLDEPLGLGRPPRIGLDPVYNSAGVDPELTASVEAAAKVLARATGGTIVPVAVPSGDELQSMVDVWGVLCAAEAVDAHTKAGAWPSRKDQYGAWFRSWLEQGETVTGVQYAEARIVRTHATPTSA